MIKEKRFQELNQLRQETIIGEILNETLIELAELGMTRVTGNKSLPFELTAKGDAATDISLFKGHGIFLREIEIQKTFNNWLNRMRKKKEEKMAKRQKNRWYVSPGDDEANDAIYNTMTTKGMEPKLTTIKYKGENLPAFECDPDFVDYLAHSRVGLPFRFRVFWEDELGTIREWKLHGRVVKKRAKAHLRKKYLKTPAQKQSAS